MDGKCAGGERAAIRALTELVQRQAEVNERLALAAFQMCRTVSKQLAIFVADAYGKRAGAREGPPPARVSEQYLPQVREPVSGRPPLPDPDAPIEFGTPQHGEVQTGGS